MPIDTINPTHVELIAADSAGVCPIAYALLTGLRAIAAATEMVACAIAEGTSEIDGGEFPDE